MADTNHTLKALDQLEKTIKAHRAQPPQAHGVLTCLYEVLLHADGEQAVPYARAAYVAASLINKSAEELDSVRILWLYFPGGERDLSRCNHIPGVHIDGDGPS